MYAPIQSKYSNKAPFQWNRISFIAFAFIVTTSPTQRDIWWDHLNVVWIFKRFFLLTTTMLLFQMSSTHTHCAVLMLLCCHHCTQYRCRALVRAESNQSSLFRIITHSSIGCHSKLRRSYTHTQTNVLHTLSGANRFGSYFNGNLAPTNVYC